MTTKNIDDTKKKKGKAGRPKGSTNKKPRDPNIPSKAGRPKGGKNKETIRKELTESLINNIIESGQLPDIRDDKERIAALRILLRDKFDDLDQVASVAGITLFELITYIHKNEELNELYMRYDESYKLYMRYLAFKVIYRRLTTENKEDLKAAQFILEKYFCNEFSIPNEQEMIMVPVVSIK